MNRFAAVFAMALAFAAPALAQTPALAPEPYGIGLEGFAYPYPVTMLALPDAGEPLRMAYMDVKPAGSANGRSVLLLHGRNFPSSYWQSVAEALTGAGYRVIIPDQVGFGKSSKPLARQSFDDLARQTVYLLDQLHLDRVDVVAHSMGGMLAVRLARSYPARVGKLLLEAPIGLEDYRAYVPPVTTERLLQVEDALTADGYRRQLVNNYSLTLPPEAITPFIDSRMRIKEAAEYPRWLRAFVNTYQTLYREPVVYDIPLLTQKTLFIMGANDHNAPGRPYAPEALRPKMGENAKLAQALAARMPDGKAIRFDGVGHLVHMEARDKFNAEMLSFLNAPR
jgi:pimeloyl-ACP methyl ester carboxylesterase